MLQHDPKERGRDRRQQQQERREKYPWHRQLQLSSVRAVRTAIAAVQTHTVVPRKSVHPANGTVSYRAVPANFETEYPHERVDKIFPHTLPTRHLEGSRTAR